MPRSLLREWLAEFLATFVLITFGVAVVAQVVLGEKSHGEYFSINLGWGLAVTLGIYVGGGVSGAHMNPAVTLALACFRRFPWSKVLPFFLAQFAGAFIASALVFAVYHDALMKYTDGQLTVVGERATAGIWATYPADYLSFRGGMVDQITGTAMLLMVVFALGDPRNLAPQSNLAPLLVGATVLLIGMTFGLNCGYAINPARDLGPRLFTYFAGWGPEVFTAKDDWWIVPVVGPLIGGVVGAAVYEFLVGHGHPPADPPA
ncbi:MAG TPA: MIP family channel protein [Gemmatales bacterium]|nr:MIP family channel protein [Gemmatales bacterium]HMP61089.1 MIP family channel protein [Gemmatales bacterium]